MDIFTFNNTTTFDYKYYLNDFTYENDYTIEDIFYSIIGLLFLNFIFLYINIIIIYTIKLIKYIIIILLHFLENIIENVLEILD